MASFRYRAATATGEMTGGVLVAESAQDARARLRQMGLFPESVAEANEGRTPWLDRLPGAATRHIPHVATFTRQCAVLLAAGVPLVEALHVLARQTEVPRLALALQEIRESVSAGRSVAEAMGRYPQYFDRAYVGMVASGERSGTMDAVFARLADFLERRRNMQARISAALVYPAILVAMVLGLLVFLSAYVVPTVQPLLQQHRRPLPATAEILFGLSHAVRAYGWIAAAALCGVAAAALALRRRAGFRDATDRWLLRAPLVGRMWQKSLVARLTMSLATLLRTGVPAVEALETLEGLTPNTAFAEELRQVRQDVVNGREISSRLRESRLFPPMVGYMVAVGERSGSLPEVLEHVAQACDTEVEIASRRLLAVLEPALVLVMAAVVGFIAMSLMVTILELSHI